MKNIKAFEAALSVLLHSWGGDTPPEAVWAFNDITLWATSEGLLPKIAELEEDLSNADAVLDSICNNVINREVLQS